MNICQTTILLNNGKYCKGKSKRFKRKFQGFSGLFCFSNRLINREIGIWRRSAVEPGREKRLRGCWTLSESADSVAQRAVVRAAFKSRMLPPPLRAPASQPSRCTKSHQLPDWHTTQCALKWPQGYAPLISSVTKLYWISGLIDTSSW